ncbi:response regulator transcription factor [Zobellella maritima]|uniref:response regulator transcription factor n=1 Tax=Zobellella maritima TaxID=2059725 RepID=UPI000E301915|nr:LuxR family transcriptional regulator [Zobellella maritima]
MWDSTPPPWLPLISDTVAAIHTPSFPKALLSFINSGICFDCALVLGYSRHHKPIYLYDTLTEQRQVLFEHYLHQAYREDPFYQAIKSGIAPGIYLLSELHPRFLSNSDYFQGFYQNTGWRDEVGIICRVNDDVTIVFSLGRLGKRNMLSQQELVTLRQLEPLIQNLCLQHWGSLSGELSATPPEQEDVKGRIDRAFSSLGGSLLTPREKEILRLVLLGHSSREIGARLGIGEGTVKNHRKRAYAKLSLGSQADLFLMFLNHLITLENGDDASYPLKPVTS